MKVYIVITEDLFSRSWANDTVSGVDALFADKEDALAVASELANQFGLQLDTDGEDVVNYWDDDEGAVFVKVVESSLKTN